MDDLSIWNSQPPNQEYASGEEDPKRISSDLTSSSNGTRMTHAMIKVNFSNYQVEATQRQLTDNSGETEHVDRMILCRVCWGFKAHTVLSLLDQSPGISVHLRKAFRICQKRGQSSSLGGLGCKYNRIFEERNISEISFHTCWRWNLPKNRVNMQVKKLRFHDVL